MMEIISVRVTTNVKIKEFLTILPFCDDYLACVISTGDEMARKSS